MTEPIEWATPPPPELVELLETFERNAAGWSEPDVGPQWRAHAGAWRAATDMLRQAMVAVWAPPPSPGMD